MINNPADVCNLATFDLTAGSITNGSTAGMIKTFRVSKAECAI